MSGEHVDWLSKIEAVSRRLTTAVDDEKTSLQREYLETVRHFLADQGRGEILVFPLLDILEQLETTQQAVSERREAGTSPSDGLLSKVCAVVDILVSAGYSLEHACQIVTRQMIARNVKVVVGGDARAWRNLQAWRHKLIALKPEPAWKTYQTCKSELMVAYGSRVAEAAARDAIWDRRTGGKSAA